jgi:multidrug resistance efflux pump
MGDVNEIRALQAALRGVRQSTEQLAGASARIESADPHAEIADADLDELRRLTLAHAVAAQALRGLVETMLRRRGKIEEVVTGNSGGGDE